MMPGPWALERGLQGAPVAQDAQPLLAGLQGSICRQSAVVESSDPATIVARLKARFAGAIINTPDRASG